MSFTLAPGISFVEQEGGRVFLDLNRDRYFALGEAGDQAFTALTHGKPDADQRASLLTLIDAHILIDLPFGENPRPCRQPALAASALDEMTATAPPFWRVLLACHALLAAKHNLKRRSLAANVARLERLKANAAGEVRPARKGEREAIAAAFAAAGRLIPTLDQCLALSFAVMGACLGSRLDAQLSIGVKLRPFEAHAWVSVDGMVISDRLDNVRPFAPILLI